MDLSTYGNEKWYNKNIFPLIPTLRTKKADIHNTSSFTFKWLFLTIWSRDSFDFELALTADTHFGIGFTALLPYLRIILTIPISEKIAIKVQRKLWRKPEILK